MIFPRVCRHKALTSVGIIETNCKKMKQINKTKQGKKYIQ